jgi:hypothetical protein
VSDTTNDIDALLDYLAAVSIPEAGRYYRTLTALVAERNALLGRVAAQDADIKALAASNAILHGRLESHPPADRDRELRENLVVAVYPILLAVAWGRPSGNTTAEDMADTLAAMRELAIVEADKMISAMRKGDK